MSQALSHIFPLDIMNIIYGYSREKTTSDYVYVYHRSANQLFYYYNQQLLSESRSHHLWTYDIWVNPSHPRIKAIEIRFDYDIQGNAIPNDISLADKSCFGIYRYPIKEGWGVAFHSKYLAFTIKTIDQMDHWELVRWKTFLGKLVTSAYLDIFLQNRLICLAQT